jgi:hypothetical protein
VGRFTAVQMPQGRARRGVLFRAFLDDHHVKRRACRLRLRSDRNPCRHPHQEPTHSDKIFKAPFPPARMFIFKRLWCACREEVGDTQPLANCAEDRRRLESSGSRCEFRSSSLGAESSGLGASHSTRPSFALPERLSDSDAVGSAILSPSQFCNLARRVLPVQSQRGAWRRIRPMPEGEAAMVTFQQALQSAKEVLLVIETERGGVFGAYLDAEGMDASREIEWSKDSCLWELADDRTTIAIHRWAGRNDRIVQCGRRDWSIVSTGLCKLTCANRL